MRISVVVLWAAGCGPNVRDVTFVPGDIPGTGTVTFTTRAEGEARVQHGVAGNALDVASPSVSSADGVVPLLGLKTGKKYEMQVVVDKGGKEVVSDVIEVTVPPPASTSPPLTVTTSDPSRMCDPGGYILFSYIGATWSGVAIIDREADYVWSVGEEDPLQVGRARPGRDGKSILWNLADSAKCTDVATIVRRPINGSAPTVTRTKQGHHDFVELPDGRMGFLGYKMERHNAEFGVDLGHVLMAADTIYEVDEGTTDPELHDVVFDTWEHYPPGVNTLPPDAVNDRGGPDFLCTDPDNEPEWGEPAYEFGHGNSLAYRESDNSYFMMWRWLDTFIKVDRGDPEEPYVWEMGGRNGTLDGDPDHLFEHAHMSDLWDGGMLVFDNRNREKKSRLVEYTFDDDGFEQVWEHQQAEPLYENILGDVRRIPVEGCDNVLVAWSGQGQISEITPEGEVVWHAENTAIGDAIARVYYLPDLYDFSGVAYPE